MIMERASVAVEKATGPTRWDPTSARRHAGAGETGQIPVFPVPTSFTGNSGYRAPVIRLPIKRGGICEKFRLNGRDGLAQAVFCSVRPIPAFKFEKHRRVRD